MWSFLSKETKGCMQTGTQTTDPPIRGPSRNAQTTLQMKLQCANCYTTVAPPQKQT